MNQAPTPAPPAPENFPAGSAAYESATRLVRLARRAVILVIGGTVVLLGIVMVLTPGPGLLVILGGLAILGTEFLWARRLMKNIKERATQAVNKARGNGKPPEKPV